MRHQTYLKAVALTLCLCLLGLCAVSCSAARPVKGTEEELRAVGTVGAYEVLYEELRYVTLKYRDAMAATYGETIWDTEEGREAHRAELEDAVMSNITSNYAVLALCDEVMISHTDPVIEEAVQDYVKDTVEQFGGRREYLAQLESEYLTDHFFRFTLAVSFCENELMYVYTDDLGLIEEDADTIYDIIMDSEQFARTLHIYIENSPGEDVEENRALAEDLLRQLNEGEKFNTLIGRHSEDFHMTTTNGYYFTHGEMVKAYEDAAFALEVGQTSGVVETGTGFYIIRRLEPDPQYVMSQLETLIDQYQYAMLYNMIEEKQDTLSLTWNDFGKTLDLTTIR